MIALGSMRTKTLLLMQHSLNRHFVRRRNRHGIVSAIYARLIAIEAELGRRRVLW